MLAVGASLGIAGWTGGWHLLGWAGWTGGWHLLGATFGPVVTVAALPPSASLIPSARRHSGHRNVWMLLGRRYLIAPRVRLALQPRTKAGSRGGRLRNGFGLDAGGTPAAVAGGRSRHLARSFLESLGLRTARCMLPGDPSSGSQHPVGDGLAVCRRGSWFSGRTDRCAAASHPAASSSTGPYPAGSHKGVLALGVLALGVLTLRVLNLRVLELGVLTLLGRTLRVLTLWVPY